MSGFHSSRWLNGSSRCQHAKFCFLNYILTMWNLAIKNIPPENPHIKSAKQESNWKWGIYTSCLSSFEALLVGVPAQKLFPGDWWVFCPFNHSGFPAYPSTLGFFSISTPHTDILCAIRKWFFCVKKRKSKQTLNKQSWSTWIKWIFYLFNYSCCLVCVNSSPGRLTQIKSKENACWFCHFST